MAQGVYGGACVEKHTAHIFDRGGMKRIGPVLDLSRVRWERARDNTSEASIRIEGNACQAQSKFISAIRSHRHEMVIYRGDERVWEGPIHRITSRPDYTEFVARDVTDYLFHTAMTQEYNNSGVNTDTVNNRMEGIINYELANSHMSERYDPVTNTWFPFEVPAWESLDPPINVLPYLVVHHTPNEAETTAVTLPFEMTVGDQLASLARQSGIDYTTVGRAIHIWDVSRNLGTIQQITEADFFAEVVVTEYGSDHTQGAYVVGQDGVYGGAWNQDYFDYYGPWVDITNAFNEEGTTGPTQTELRSQAVRNIVGRSPVPAEVRVPDNSGLILSETLTINMLVPGVQVPLRARLSARPMSQMQKIDHVVVTETSAGETIQVTLTPTTRPDSDIEEEE